MRVKRFVRPFIAALVSLALVFGAFPSFAATSCCDPANMAMHMSMKMAAEKADTATHAVKDQHHSMPCKMPAGRCASICASMETVAVAVPAFQYVASEVVADLGGRHITPSGGISEPPDLPPPIILA